MSGRVDFDASVGIAIESNVGHAWESAGLDRLLTRTRSGTFLSVEDREQSALRRLTPRRMSESANLAPVCAKSARRGLHQSASPGLPCRLGSKLGFFE